MKSLYRQRLKQMRSWKLNGIKICACNQVGECPSPLLAARPVCHFSGMFPLHGAAHKKYPVRDLDSVPDKTFK